jgi:hypothetical protein
MRFQGEAPTSPTMVAAGCAAEAEAEAGELALCGGQDSWRRRDCGSCCSCGCGGAVASQPAAAATTWGQQGCCCCWARVLMYLVPETGEGCVATGAVLAAATCCMSMPSVLVSTAGWAMPLPLPAVAPVAMEPLVVSTEGALLGPCGRTRLRMARASPTSGQLVNMRRSGAQPAVSMCVARSAAGGCCCCCCGGGDDCRAEVS